ncbi:MAG: hypothetical protein ACRDF7_05135 [Candidatus Limnocylindrales bacterium]
MRIKDARRSSGPSAAVRGMVLVAVVALVGAVALSITGGLGGAIADLGHSLGGLVGGIAGASASPTSSGDVGVEGAPRLEVPINPWTNQPLWDVKGLLPSGVAGSSTLTLRVYVGIIQVAEVPVPPTADFVVPAVPLQPGANQISAAIVDTNGEGPRSAAIQVNFDDQPPDLTISSPKNGSTTTSTKVTVSGKTQASSTIAVANQLTGGAASTQASSSGSFKVDIDIGSGSNALSITSTDPAGNETTVTVTVKHGGGQLAAKLSLSSVRINQSSLPVTLVITLAVTDVGGSAVNGATVDFTISPPGQPTSTFTTVTAGGKAKWSVSIPKFGTTKASGIVTARVTLTDGRVVSTSAGFSVV